MGQWSRAVELLSLLFMPHFGWTREVDTYVKQLLVFFHASFLWLDRTHSIDVDLISAITIFSRARKDPEEKLWEGKNPDNIA